MGDNMTDDEETDWDACEETTNMRKNRSRVEFLLNTCLIHAKDSCRDKCAKGVFLTHEVKKGIPCDTVWGDSDVLRTTLVHVISNAVRHTSAPGSITIGVQLVERVGIEQIRLRFEVKDTGPSMSDSSSASTKNHSDGKKGSDTKDGGVSREAAQTKSEAKITVEKTTEAMRTASVGDSDETEISTHGATATAEVRDRSRSDHVGLSSAELLVEQLGGTMTVTVAEPTANGRRGTTVTFTALFDIGQTVGAAGVALGTPPPTPGLRFRSLQVKSALVVDDEKVNRLMVGRLLTNNNYQVDLACDGQEALNLLFPEDGDEKEYSVILMDVDMPFMTGMEATEIIRSKGSKIPVLALTGDNSKENQMRCMWSGMTAFIGKPFKKNDVMTTVTKWCKSEHFQAKGFTSVGGEKSDS